jgi:hypothetical protein
MAAAAPDVSTKEHDNNLETYSLVWLDSAVKEAKEYLDAQERIRK